MEGVVSCFVSRLKIDGTKYIILFLNCSVRAAILAAENAVADKNTLAAVGRVQEPWQFCKDPCKPALLCKYCKEREERQMDARDME